MLETGIADAAERQRIDQDLASDLLISAGAGSGKTSKLVDRYLALLTAGVEPARIAVVTFTRKAATEMKERIRARLAAGGLADAERLARAVEDAPIETIDAFCLRLLRGEALAAGLDPGFAILDAASQETLPRQVCADLLRRALWADDPAAEALLEQVDSFRDALALLTDALRLRKLWRDPFRRPPEPAAARRCWAYLRGEIDDLPAAAELAAELACTREALAETTVTELRSGELWAAVAAHWPNLAPGAEKAAEDDGFRPVYEAIGGLLRHPDEPAAETLRRLGGLSPLACNKGTKGVWGDAVGDGKSLGKQLRDRCREKDLAALIQACPEDELACAEATVAVLPLVRAAEAALVEAKQRHGALAFEDLVLSAARLLNSPEGQPVLERVRRRLTHFLVDEYQDTDGLQDALFRHLAGDRAGAFFAVGDDKQSIYGFRGAEVAVFNRARQAAGDGHLQLSTTFRLTPPLAETLNGLFAHPSVMGEDQHDDPTAAVFVPLRAVDRPERVTLPGPAVRLLCVPVPEGETAPVAEAEAVAESIAATVAEGRELSDPRDDEAPPRKLGYRDVMVLMRGTTHLERYRDALLARGIPVRTERGRLSQRQEACDLLALGRWLETPGDAVALVTVLRSPLVCLPDDTLYWLARERPLAETVQTLLAEPETPVPGLDAAAQAAVTAAVETLQHWREVWRRRPVSQVLRGAVAEGYGAVLAALPDGDRALANVEKLLDDLAAAEHAGLSGSDALAVYEARRDEKPRDDPEGLVYDPDADAVSLLTVHGAKGLERPLVYLVDVCRKRGGQSAAPQVAPWAGMPLAAGRREGQAVWPVAAQAQAAAKGPRLEFEEERLLYVACTRARDRLVIAVTPELGKADGSFYAGSWLSALADGLGFVAPDQVTLPGVGVDPAGPVVRPTRDDLAQREAALAALTLVTELPAPCRPLPEPTAPTNVTRLLREAHPGYAPDAAPAETVTLSPAIRERLTAPQRGSIIHELLRLAVLARRAPVVADVWPAAARQGVLLDPDEDRAIAEHLAGVAQRGFEHRRVQAVLAAELALPEVPFLLEDEGRLVEGRMDLVGVTTVRVLLVDYKTGSRTAEKEAGYRAEVGFYARALRRRYPDRAVEAALLWLDLEEMDDPVA